jgi:hypothetical protein
MDYESLKRTLEFFPMKEEDLCRVAEQIETETLARKLKRESNLTKIL